MGIGGGFWAGLAGGLGTGLTIGEKLKQLGVNSEIAGVTGQQSTPVASGEEAAAAGMKAYQEQMDRAQTDEEKKQIEQNFRPTLDALQNDATRPASVAYSLGAGDSFKQQDKAFSADDIAQSKLQQRADIYRKHGMNDEADRLEERAQQRQLTGYQITEAKTRADHTKKLSDVESKTSEYAKSLMKKDANGNTLPLDEDAFVNLGKYHTMALADAGLYDQARVAAKDGMDYAIKKIQSETAERQAAVARILPLVAQATPQGDQAAMEAYNRFVPDGSKAVGVVRNKDGTITVQRVSTVDGQQLPPGTFRNQADLVAAIQGIADPNALANQIERTFQHDILSRKTAAEEKSASAHATSASAAVTQAQTGINKEKRANDKEDRLAKATADYQEALDSGDAKKVAKAKIEFLGAGGKLEKPAAEFAGSTDQLGNTNVIDKTSGGGMKLNNTGQVVARWNGVKDSAAGNFYNTPADVDAAKKKGTIKSGDTIQTPNGPMVVK